MKIFLASQVINGEYVPMNSKGCEETEIELADVQVLSLDKRMRLVGLGKNLYRMTLKSYKELKQEFNKRGMLYRFDSSKR
jgi:hypothetical protein